MKPIINDVHQQFAEYFHGKHLAPYAYLVSRKLSEGHICVELGALEEDTEALPAGYRLLEDPLRDLLKEDLVTGPSGEQPFVLYEGRLYLRRYFRYETMILEGIARLLRHEKGTTEVRMEAILKHDALIRELFPRAASGPADWQLAGVLLGAIHQFTILTGGPGTGKTTTLSKLLTVLYALDPGAKVALAAPTGKAAMRMAESLERAAGALPSRIREKIRSLEPMTLHRLLKPQAGTPYFQHQAKNPLAYDVIVVDEASMIDAALLAKLLDAVPEESRLILLGDKHQLASVEAGSMLGDLAADPARINVVDEATGAALSGWCPIPVPAIPHPLSGHIIELKESHRFGDQSAIGKISRAILGGDAEAVLSDQEITIDTANDPEILPRFAAGFERYIREPDIRKAYELFGALRILCAVWEGDKGVYRINDLVEEYLRKRQLIRQTGVFYMHRPVIIGRNYYELGLFNGDTGIVRPDPNGVLKAWFPDGEGGMRDILPHYIREAETVFAMTIHKSQGSEFEEVLVVLPDHDRGDFLTRELLYTAVTRAKEKLVIQGAEPVIRGVLSRTVRRVSGIHGRLEKDFPYFSS